MVAPTMTTMSSVNELAVDVDKRVAYTGRLLSQVEGAGMDFYTIHFARLACVDVHVSPQGQRIFNNCFSNLPRFAALDERLQFGFGDKHVLKNADVQLYEYEHLLLATALAEFFSEDYVAAVFSALADYFEDVDRPKPRLSSFRNFVRASNGLLTLTEFPLLVDNRIRLNPYHDYDGGLPHAETTNEFVPIGKVAEALRMLGQLKTGRIKQLTFIGGDILGWLSAFIEEFLGLGQKLMDKDSQILHWSNGHVDCVNLIFMPPDIVPAVGDPSVLWLRRPLDKEKRSDKLPPILSGRVIGEAMFSKVFGRAFHILDQTKASTFGDALGGTARSLELWIEQADAPSKLMSEENSADPGTWGCGLIQTWTNWFPELRHLQGRMERAWKKDLKAAGQLCDESIRHLEPFCGCYICSKTQGTDENPKNLPKHDFCTPTMMETIIKLGFYLSRVTLVRELHPSRAGVLAMYKAQVKRRLQIKRQNATGWDRYKILFGEDFNSTTSAHLQNIVTLFSGSRPTADLPDNLMAISHEGMCAYVLKLQRGDRATEMTDDNVIRVVVGSINWRQKTYSRLCVGPVQPPVDVTDGWEMFNCDHFNERIFVK